jgi:hypothetical protein
MCRASDPGADARVETRRSDPETEQVEQHRTMTLKIAVLADAQRKRQHRRSREQRRLY